MSFLRTLSTGRLFVLVGAVLALAGAGAGAAIAVAAGGGGPTPPPKPLNQALHDALAAPKPDGVTARIAFTNNLFPSGSLTGNLASALISGASGRLWATADGRGRIELQSDAGDVQIVWNETTLTIYDASSNTVYRMSLPASAGSAQKGESPPTLTAIDDFLGRLAGHATVSAANPVDVAGRPAYSVAVSPKHDGGLLGSAELAWDAEHGVPLRVAVYAQGSSTPVLELRVTDISYGPVAAGDVEVSPPAGAKVVDLGSAAANASHAGNGTKVSGLDAVRAAVDFPVVAPATLVGLPRRDVRLVGGGDSRAALVLYGQGLGAVAVVERKADATANGGPLTSLPSVSLDGVTAHELSTQLGTALVSNRDGTAFVLAGSLPSAAAEASARDLR